MRRKAIILTIILVAVVFVIVGRMRHKPAPAAKPDTGISVQVGYARLGTMASTIDVSGSIKALKSVQISAKSNGRVVSVPFREGDVVHAGQVVVQQDTSDLRAQLRQADAGVQAARSRLSQAMTSESVSETQTDAQIASARAALDAARAHLQIVKSGARTQERAEAESAVASAKAAYDNAKTNRDRMRSLFVEGALSAQQMDQAETQYEIASAQYESAKQQLSLVREGARPEEIQAAENQVQQADEALRLAKTNKVNKALRLEDIKGAKAGVSLAEATRAYARQQLANASIRTPIAGTISKRMTEPGEMANSGDTLIELVALNTTYFDATVSEIDMHSIRVGQPVRVQIDALPGRTFAGSVLKVLPTADQGSRQFHVWIAVPNESGELKPGMFARGGIRIDEHRNTVVVPKDAVSVNGSGFSLYVVSQSKARLQPVTLGFTTRDEAEILSGVSAGDEVVVLGQDRLSDGVKVNVAN